MTTGSKPNLHLSPLRHLSATEMKMLYEVNEVVYLQRGDFLNQKDRPVDFVYYVESGYVKIVWPDQRFSKESIIKIVAPGDFTGYRCVFSETHYRATAVALGPVKVIKIPKNFFIELLIANKDFNFEILNMMGIEIRNAEKKLHSYCVKNVRERLAECLIYLNNLSGTIDENGNSIIQIKLSRDELSSLIGTAKETVVRALSDLKEEKIIDQDSDLNTIILDLKKLIKISTNIN